MVELMCVSVSKSTIKDRQTGQPVEMSRVWCVVPSTGEVGSFYTTGPAPTAGEVVQMTIAVDKDGRFVAKPARRDPGAVAGKPKAGGHRGILV